MPPQSPTGTENGTLDDVEEVTAEPIGEGEGPRESTPGSTPGSGSALATPLPEARGGRLAVLGSAPVVVQAAAVAATGIVAGMATGALVRAARARGPATRPRPQRRAKGGIEVVETRTYVVDVHLVGRR